MIKIKNIHKSFGTLEVLKGVDLTVEKGDIVSIIGKSGAGKTTLLQIIGTLDKPDKGQIIIAAEGMFTKDENDKNKFYTLVGNEMKTLTKDQIKGLTEFSKDRKYNYSKEFQVGDVKNLLDDMVETCKLSSNLEV